MSKIRARESIGGCATSEVDYDSLLETFARAYVQDELPIEVDFLKLFPDRSGAERSTHLIHPYPAKLIRNIPRLMLACKSVAPKGTKLLDPFCGSGTVLLEGRLSGLDVVGADANPLARLIATAKLTPPTPAACRKQLEQIMKVAPSSSNDMPDVVNVEYWFAGPVRNQLAKLRTAILSTCGDLEAAPFIWATFSSCVRRVSLADPRLSVPVRINPERSSRYGANGDQVIQRFERLHDIDVFQVFWQIMNGNIKRAERTAFPKQAQAPIIYDDARNLGCPDASLNLIITSPPYVGAQKYIRASSLSLGWLGLSPEGKLRPLERLSIGREHMDASDPTVSYDTGFASIDNALKRIAERNLSRARIASTYMGEMFLAIKECYRVLRHSGKMVLVVGPNMVAGQPFDTPGHLAEMAKSIGFRLDIHLLDNITSRGLMTKRNKTAGTIAQEAVFLFTKV